MSVFTDDQRAEIAEIVWGIIRPAPITGKVSDAEIETSRSPRGGWTRETLAQWGVPWPPPKGWRKALTAKPARPDAQPTIPTEQRDAA